MKSNQQRLGAVPSPPPSALMIAFPLARRVHAVARIAERMADAKSREKAEDILDVAIRRQRATMARKGISPTTINRECARLENAVRARLWTIIFAPPPNDAA